MREVQLKSGLGCCGQQAFPAPSVVSLLDESIIPLGGSSCKIVAMMQAAKPGHGDDFRSHRCVPCGPSVSRSLLAQPKMRSVVVVVGDIFAQEPL